MGIERLESEVGGSWREIHLLIKRANHSTCCGALSVPVSGAPGSMVGLRKKDWRGIQSLAAI